MERRPTPPPDPKRIKRIRELLRRGVYTPNQIREIEGFPPESPTKEQR